MSTDLDKVLQKLQAAQSRNIAQVEQAQKRMGIETP